MALMLPTPQYWIIYFLEFPNRKNKEGDSHPDRDAQFQYIHDQVQDFQQRCQPVISVDTKKKELIGDNGQEWQPKKQPIEVKSHDFPDEEMGKVVPYGVYDLAANQGWVNVVDLVRDRTR